MALVGAHRDKFGERAIGGRGGAATAEHDGLAAQIAAAGFAVVAEAAGAGRVDRDAGADLRGGHVRGHRGHVGGELMAEDERPRRDKGPAVAVLEVVHVRAADARAPDAQQHHARAEFGPRDLLHPEIFGPVKDAG